MFFIFIGKHFNSFLIFKLCRSQTVRLNFLLASRCSLSVTFCSLLVVCYFLFAARYFLLVARCSLLFARYSLVFCSLLITFCSLLVTFCSSARCLLWNKVTVNRKKMVWLLQNSATDIFLANFWDFCNFSGCWFSKFSQHAKPFSKLAQSRKYWIPPWCLYHNIWTRF